MNTGSANDHFKWGWDNKWFGTPQTTSSKFQISLTSAGTCGSFHDETVRAVEHLANNSTKPILVGFSGGIDSQAICLALIEAKIPFTALTMKWLDARGRVINTDDVKFATKFCALHNIKHQIETASLEEFLVGLGTQVAEQFCIQYYRLLTHVYFANKFKDSHAIVIGAYNVTFDTLAEKLVVDFETSIVQQYFLDNNIEGTAHFFRYTPELMLSQIDNDTALAFMESYQSLYSAFTEDSKTPYLTWRMFGSYVKPLIYQANWDGLLHRSKRHGFETYDDSYWKRHITDLGGKKFGNSHNMIAIKADEFLNFMRMPKGTEHIWRLP